MDVYEAVTSRRAVRGFTDEPVSREVLERVLSAAAEELPIWHAARDKAEQDGVLMVAWPFHCAVGTRPMASQR